jgi:parallel beta-helix repeat protein
MFQHKYLYLAVSISLALVGIVALLWLADTPSTVRATLSNRYVAVTGNDNSNVCTTGSNPCRTIQHAVDVADVGDSILIASGVYTDVQDRPVPPGYRWPPASGLIAQVVYITKTLTLRGGYTSDFSEPPDPQTNPTTVDAQGAGRTLVIAGYISSTIEGLRLTGGEAYGLGGSDLWEETDAGGSVYVISATATLENNQIFQNNARDGGGVYLHGSPTTLSHNEIYSNTTQYTGGAVMVYRSNATLDANIIHHNSAYYLYGTSSGGGVFVHVSPATLSANVIYSNTAQSNGGGIYVNNSHNITLINNIILSNTTAAGRGGGIDIRDSDNALLSGNTVIGNQAYSRGGGMYVYQGYDTLVGNTIIANTAESGGGVYLVGRAVTMTANTVLSNTALVGGGLYLEYNDAILNRNTISYNRTYPDLGEGGGVFLEGSSPSMDGNILTFNFAANWGGGIALYNDSSPVMINTVVADNMAGEYGGGISIRQHSEPRLFHSTIARNRGGDGSGISVIHGEMCDCTVDLTNTILVSHTVGITVSEFNTVTMVGTLWYSNTTNWAGAGTIIASAPNVYSNPLFATDGYHLSAGSPAINQGVPTGVTSDIDGQPRDAQPDLGADEYVICTPLTGVTITGPTSGYTGAYYEFTAVITPTGATPPVVYTWSPEPASGQGSDTATFSWTDEGEKIISITASNCASGGTASDEHVIAIIGGVEWQYIYLPVVWKNWP